MDWIDGRALLLILTFLCIVWYFWMKDRTEG